MEGSKASEPTKGHTDLKPSSKKAKEINKKKETT
jgi:hypothetical protein